MRLSAGLLLSSFIVLCRAPLPAEPDLYSFPEVDASKPKTAEAKPVNPFARSLSKKMEMPEEVLSEAIASGMGRLELIRLILISKKSGKPLPDLLKQRNKTRFSKIAAEAKADNAAIKKEAMAILETMEAELKAAKPAAGTEAPKDKPQ
ncbi:MAG: hypothetical protein A2901_03480 [Elusimicrobia bacterium RIFCSPLOWO2_01_FULL_54_10]|nr:MAG: hypothetical protein A2901_03480 [Elusimicrobia bacterium RIFCSPLOWO2_01_FULL_54_10]